MGCINNCFYCQRECPYEWIDPDMDSYRRQREKVRKRHEKEKEKEYDTLRLTGSVFTAL